MSTHDSALTTDPGAPRTMWAVTFHEIGEPADVLVEEEVAVPEPGPGQVRVRVLTVDVNPADWELCRGYLPGELPRGIGLDVAGIVDAVGEGVAGTRPGDLVFGTTDFVARPTAGVATHAVLDLWFPVPDGLDLDRAAALVMPLRTAAWTLDAMGVGEGTRLLVHGGGSTIGHAAVQIARRRGADVVATAGSTHAAALEGFGARVTSYGDGMAERVRALATGPFDAVLDASPTNPESLPQLVEIAGDPALVTTVSNHAQATELGAHSNLVPTGRPLTPLAELVPEYAALAAAGEFSLPVAATYPMDRWRDAMDLSVSGRARGKVVLRAQR